MATGNIKDVGCSVDKDNSNGRSKDNNNDGDKDNGNGGDKDNTSGGDKGIGNGRNNMIMVEIKIMGNDRDKATIMVEIKMLAMVGIKQ